MALFPPALVVRNNGQHTLVGPLLGNTSGLGGQVKQERLPGVQDARSACVMTCRRAWIRRELGGRR